MKKAQWKRMAGILFAAALLSGCAKQTYVEITTAEETKPATTSVEIRIETTTTEAEPENSDLPPYYLPEERVAEDALIRSYLTGEITDTAPHCDYDEQRQAGSAPVRHQPGRRGL